MIKTQCVDSNFEVGSKNFLHFPVNLGELLDCAGFLEQNLKRSTFKLCCSEHTSKSNHGDKSSPLVYAKHITRKYKF
ncbi:hypothetical protein ACROYT_G027889 [Oculina patagonica]